MEKLRSVMMVPEFEFVRGNERLQCDWPVWRRTTDLAIAFGWKPESIDPKKRSPRGLMHSTVGVEITDEDAQSLALAIRRCLSTLEANRRPTRRQIAHLLMSADKNDIEGNSIRVRRDELDRIANFCHGGGFRITPTRQSA
jgi:hypothetical protein